MTGRILDPLENKRYLNKWCDKEFFRQTLHKLYQYDSKNKSYAS